jgi:CBS domain containing-hemolysin-like protein
MDVFSWAGVALLVLCLGLAVFVAAAEAGLISISRARVRLMAGRGVPRADILHSYVQERSALLGALWVARYVAIMLVAGLAVSILTRERGASWELLVAIVVVALVLFALLEALTRALVARNPEWWGLRLAPFMGPFKLLFGGVGRILRMPARVVSREGENEEEEILRIMEIEEEAGEIEEDERKMIRGVFGLEGTAVREIMTPRTDVAAVDTEATVNDIVQVIVGRGFSRIPLYEKNADTIVGIIYAKDLFRYMAEGRVPKDLREIARPAFFVPESKRLDDLLTDMRKQRVHMAIVVDEYGGTAGLVTIEDLLEEIVGEIEDEYDIGEAQIVRVSDDEALLDGRVSIDDLNELFGTHVENEDYDTVGGCVFHELGRVPAVGDAVEADGVKLTVLSVEGHRVRKLRATRSEKPPPDPGNGKRNGEGNGNGKKNGEGNGKPKNGAG